MVGVVIAELGIRQISFIAENLTERDELAPRDDARIYPDAKSFEQAARLAGIERFVNGEAGALRHVRIVAGRIDRRHDGDEGGKRDHRGNGPRGPGPQTGRYDGVGIPMRPNLWRDANVGKSKRESGPRENRRRTVGSLSPDPLDSVPIKGCLVADDGHFGFQSQELQQDPAFKGVGIHGFRQTLMPARTLSVEGRHQLFFASD